MTMIGTLKGEHTKKAILTQKKMFVSKNMFPKENLTPNRHRLYMTARKYSKEIGYRFVWTRNGNIFLRKDELSPKILITNKTVFEDL